MKKCKVLILPLNKEIVVEEGTTLIDVQRMAGLRPDAPCGGNGICGKCLVEIISDGKSIIEKACTSIVQSDMIIKVDSKMDTNHLLMNGEAKKIDIDSIIREISIKVDPAHVGDSLSEWERVKKSLAKTLNIPESEYSIDVSLLSDLYDNLSENNNQLTVVLFGNEVIEVKKSGTKKYVMAFDIGTTSIVGYLLDIETAEQIATVSILNPQTQYGGDVINRSNYAIENGIEYLTDTVRTGLNQLISKASLEAGIQKKDIYLVSIVGNTCMHHLFLGISPKPLVHAPYNPVIREKLVLKAKELGIDINNYGRVLMLPNIAGFVGADTSGVLLATAFDFIEPLTLMIDIGTNGELVMGNKQKMIACSCAAGPAFEGANIHYGMRGKDGAIDHYKIVGTNLEYTVIGNIEPAGICGSGLMDIIAVLLDGGFIDETGKLIDADSLVTEVGKANKFRLQKANGENVFVIYQNDENNEMVYITQKDVREVQLAKAAMAAGIELMANKLNIQVNDIKQVLIAGAFGSYMSPHSACKIGLIPQILEDRIVTIGNAAGEGAKMAAINYKEFCRSEQITGEVEFLELATNPKFQDCFVEQLEF